MKMKQKFRKAISFLLSTIMIMMICFGSGFGTITVHAIDYSIGESDGFSLDSENNVSATFTITNKLGTGTMKGWLLCLFKDKPSINTSTGKLNDSGNIHPYSYSNCAYYFFSSDTEKVTGTRTASWSGTATDEKGSGKTLAEVIREGDWHIVIGPRYYYTGWSGSGIGAGTNGIWENADYYIGQASEKIGGYDEPQNTALNITLDRTNYADGSVLLITYNSEGDWIAETNTNNDTISMPGDGYVRVFTDSEFTVTAEGATIGELLNAGEEGYYREITNFAGDTTVVVNKVEAAPEVTCDITLDRTNYADGSVLLITYNSEGDWIAETNTNNDTISMPEDGYVRVFTDSEFTVTAEGATIGELLNAGEEGYYRELTGITGDTTVVVNKKQNAPVVTPPEIITQPQNASVKVGEKATFSVTASGENLSYQWKVDRNDGKGFVNLTDATSASYTTSTVDMDCNGFKYQCTVSNEGGSVTSNTVTLTVTETPTVHTHSLTIVPEKEATCTEDGNTAYYTCSGCDNLFADANGTTTTTAETVKVAALEHDWSGEWTVTKEATETEEGEKETLCVRGCGQKKTDIIPVIGTSGESGAVEKDTSVEPDAPIDEATLDNSKEELLEAGNIFTDEDKSQIENGTDAKVWLEISKTDEGAIASTDKEKIEQEAAKIVGANPNISYFDADLFKQIGNGTKEPISEPGIAIKITIAIPDELLNRDESVVREYSIVRLHAGKVDIIRGTFNKETGEFSFESDKFSTYAIIYKDVPVVEDNDTPSDGGNTSNPEQGGNTSNPEQGGNNSNPEQGGNTSNPEQGGNNNPTQSGDNNSTTNNDVVKTEGTDMDTLPKTGDSDIALYSFVFMLVGGLGLVFCMRRKRAMK